MKVVYDIARLAEPIGYDELNNEREIICVDRALRERLGEFLSIAQSSNGLQDYVYYLKDDGSIDKIEIEKCIIINEQENETNT